MREESPGGIFTSVRGEDAARSPLVGDVAAYYIYGPRGQARVIACPLEQMTDAQGELLVWAVSVRCPVCGTHGRVTSDKPFQVDNRRTAFETENGLVYLSPILTIESEYSCGATVKVVENDGDSPQLCECQFKVIIRGGIAYDLDVVPKILTDAMQAAHDWYSRAVGLYNNVRVKLDPSVRTKIDKMLNDAFAVVNDRCPVIERGIYDRGGPHSVVGCWDGLDFVCNVGQHIIKSFAGK